MRLLPPEHPDGWTSYVWLIYLNVYVAYPLYYGATWWEWIAQAAGLLAFLPLYFRGFWVDGARRLPVIAALAVLGTALTWMNPGASVFFVYAASFVGGSLTGRAAVGAVLAIAALGVAAAAPTGPWFPAAGGFVAVFAPLIGLMNLYAAAGRRRDAALRLAHEEIARLARLSERDRIAADLHDLLGHSLSVIVLKADLAAKLIERDPRRAADEMRDVSRVSREALAEVRHAVQGFRTATFADELARARAALETAGIAVTVDVPRAGSGPATAELAFVLREAVTNVLRHAAATMCEIRLVEAGGSVVLTVRDDGRGGEIREGNGWRGMRERVEAQGGTLARGPGAGVSVIATVPSGRADAPCERHSAAREDA